MPNTPAVVSRRYYPRLSSIVSQDDLPEILGFVKDGLENLFEKLHYKDLQHSKSPSGDAAFYSLSIVSDRIDIELPGTGIFLVFNPDLTGSDFTISTFPITLEYQWKILKYLNSFNIGNFSYDPKEIFEIALNLLDISEESALVHFVNAFVTPDDDSVTPLEQFISDINSENSGWGSPIPQSTTDITAIVNHITGESGEFSSLVAFKTYLLKDDIKETLNKVKSFFRAFLPSDINEYIKDILIPKFRVTLLLSAAIEFPRNILYPYKQNGSIWEREPEDSVVMTRFYFGQILLYVDNQKGIGYNMDLVGNLQPAYSEIGKTGLLIQLEKLKLDLSDKVNIPEADADGRPENFRGVYADALSVTLPTKWFKTPANATGSTLRIGGYNLLIGTGGLSGTFALEAVPTQNASDGQITDFFSSKFSFIYPIKGIRNNTTSNQEEVVEITNSAGLLTYLNSLTNKNLYSFKYPLQLIPNGGTTIIEFTNQEQFRTYITDLVLQENGTLWFNLGKSESRSWRIGFNRFDITFKQNQVVSSHLHAQLELKKFKKEGQSTTALVDLVGEWESEENFKLSASFSPPLSLNLFDLLTVKFQGVEIGKDDGDFFITADTKLSFPPSSLAYSMFNGQEIDLPAIRFYFDGRFEIVGGNAFIPLNFSIKILDTFEMSVTGIHLGSVQRERNGIMRKYNYIGFDGGLSIDPIGVDVRGKGVKYYYTIDNDEPGITDSDSYFHIGTLELDLIIPGTASPSDAVAIIKGSLTIPEPGISSEYRGKISIQLPQANIYGEATMRLNPKYPAYLIDASVDFPVPIPLGPVGINGFRGLIGQRYVAEKRAIEMTDENTWYEYYMAPQRGISDDKFSGPEETKDYETAFSVGIGATISTMDGGGRTASLRAMVLLSLPSMFAIDAGLTILSERLGLAEDDPTVAPFYAFVIIGDDSLEFGAGANFQLNKSNGWVLDIRAELQAGFFFRNQRPWYINFGTRQNPITATLFKDVLSLRAYSFLMLSASGIEAGARVDFEFNFVIAKLQAGIEVGGYVSFERPQIGGYIKAWGDLEIDFWIFDLTAHISTYFRVEIPKPFLIYAEIRIRVCARIKIGPFKVRICIPLKFVLKWQKNNIIDYTPVPALTYEPVDDADYSKDVQISNFVKGVHMMTFETFELDYLGVNISEPNHSLINKIIPLDTYVDIKVEKGLNPSPVSNKIGGHTGGATGFVDLIPPKQQQPGGHTLNQVKHKYSIEEIEIKAWSEVGQGQWINYHPFRAVLPEDDTSVNLKIGFWQKNNNQYDTIRLLSTNPFSFLDGAEPGWFIPEQYGITPTDLFCTSNILTQTCCNVLNKTLGTTYYPPTQYEAHYINGVYFNIKGYFEQEYGMGEGSIPVQDIIDNTMVVSNVPNPHGFAQSLEFKNFNILVITLPESSAKVDLKISTYSQGVTIRYYRTLVNDASLFQSFQLIEEVYKTNAELVDEVSFNNTSPYDNLRNVLKIEIIPDSPNIDEIYSAQEELAELMNSAEEASQGASGVILSPEQLQLYNQLITKIEDLKSIVCSGSEGSPCEIDELLCALYNQLLSIYADCFLTYEEKFIYMYCQERTCFHDFIKLIELFHQNNPQYQLLTNYINPQYLLYNEQLGQLSAWCGQQNPDTETVFNFYNSFLSNTMTMINIIGELGNCNCTGGEILNCSTSIQSVCWTTLEDYEYSQTFPTQDAVEEDMNSMIEGFQATAQPVWRPNTKYYIRFKLKDEVDNGQRDPGEYNYFYGFRTVGPVGHFHKYPNAYTLPANSNQSEYPLTSLGKYLDYERSYPNADGSLLQSKPLFYGNEQCRIDLFFEKSFAYHMLNTWGAYRDVGETDILLPEIKGAMHLAIKDPISDVIIPYPLPVDWELSDSVPETVGNGDNGVSWVNDDDPRIPLNIQILNNYINLVNANSNAIQCDIDLGDPIRPASYTYSVTLTNLKPRKLYTALVYNAFDENGDGQLSNQVDPATQVIIYEESQKVHEYVFQTSRYANFREQVESFKLKEYSSQGSVVNEKEAIYEVIVSLTPEQVNDAYTLVSGETNAALDLMKIQFYHDFDRAIEGVFGLIPADPPTTTDFIKIKNTVDGNVIALLLRNPEPFNNPKMPFDVAQDTIRILTDTQQVNWDYKVLYSKDYSQAIIMHTSKLIEENLNIRFKYKIWNGSQYIIPNIHPVTGNIIDVTKDIGIIDIENLQIINS